MDEAGRYDHLSRDALVALLERRDNQRRYGLVWEREGIEPDRALNDDFVALDLDPELSTKPLDAEGWRNLVIEGDNWDALRALRLAYAGRIRCILIDPPYNTGSQDFTYNDRYVGTQDRYRQSLWLEFLYRRLVLSRDLLADDGVIMVCINDENNARMDLLMEQVFPGMRIGSFVWKTRSGSNDQGDHSFSVDHEHILIYGNQGFEFTGAAKDFRQYKNLDGDPLGPWKTGDLTKGHSFNERPRAYYPVQNPDTGIWYPCNPTRVWAFATEQAPPAWKRALLKRKDGVDSNTSPKNRQPTMEEWIRRRKIVWPDAASERVTTWETREDLLSAINSNDIPKANRGRTPLLRKDMPDLDFWVGKPVSFERPWFRRHLSDVRSNTSLVSSWIRGVSETSDAPDNDVSEVTTQRSGTSEDSVKEILGHQAFSFPKPPSLFREILRYATDQDDIVLDFFAGSGTTGHAVLALNAEDEGRRRFILVSSRETNSENPGRNLCRDVCAERVRRVIQGYSGVPGLDGDFAYLHARRVPWDDILYDLDHPAVWNVIQLRNGRLLKPYDNSSELQVTLAVQDDPEAPVLIYAPRATEGAVARIRQLVEITPAIIFTPAPGLMRDLLAAPTVPIEQVPDRILADFPQRMGGH